jgi:hypothetical protein
LKSLPLGCVLENWEGKHTKDDADRAREVQPPCLRTIHAPNAQSTETSFTISRVIRLCQRNVTQITSSTVEARYELDALWFWHLLARLLGRPRIVGDLCGA